MIIQLERYMMMTLGAFVSGRPSRIVSLARYALTLVQHVTHSGPEVFFKTCVAMKFVDDDDDDDDDDASAVWS